MARIAVLLALVASFFLVPCKKARADSSSYPWYDFQDRATLGLRLEHRWQDSPIVSMDNAVGIAGSYALVPKWALTGKVLYRIDATIVEYDLGVNFKFYGKE